MSEYHCTICNTLIEQYDEVILVQAAAVTADGDTTLCHSPNIEALCDRCAGDLDKFLQALREIRQHPFNKALVLQRVTTNLVPKEVTP